MGKGGGGIKKRPLEVISAFVLVGQPGRDAFFSGRLLLSALGDKACCVVTRAGAASTINYRTRAQSID